MTPRSNAKLTEEMVQAIRALVGKRTYSAIARHFAVSRQNITGIAQRKTWSWVPNASLKELPDIVERPGRRGPWCPRLTSPPRAGDELFIRMPTRRKLTIEQVQQIRSLIGTYSYSAIARHYGVTLSNIKSIATGKTWAWLPVGPPQSLPLLAPAEVKQRTSSQRAEVRTKAGRAMPTFDRHVARAVYVLAGDYPLDAIGKHFSIHPVLVEAILTDPAWEWLRRQHESANS